jgi:hypothetical protein
MCADSFIFRLLLDLLYEGVEREEVRFAGIRDGEIGRKMAMLDQLGN